MGRKLLFLILPVLALAGTNVVVGETWEGKITDSQDCVEQSNPTTSGAMDFGSSDLEFVDDGGIQTIGLRFTNVQVPAGATITKAYVVLTTEEVESNAACNLIIQAHLAPNAAAFASTAGDIARRPLTTAVAKWSPEHWAIDNEKHPTSDISAVIAEVVNQPGWAPGNAIAVIFNQDPAAASLSHRTTHKTATPEYVPLLHIEYTLGTATGPNPGNKATDVPSDALLSWNASPYAVSHDVYFGTVAADVDAASRTDAKGVLAQQGQADATYDPAGVFAYGQTYYWRIDEVNQSAKDPIYKGPLWSFTVEPYAYPITPIKATASSSQPNMGPEKTIDGSGLAGDLHGTDPGTMWMSMGVLPNWIQYEFDKAYKLYQLLVWNSNQMIEGFMGFGAKTVKIETSLDGTTWTELANVPEFGRGTGLAGYAANTTVNFAGVQARFVKLTISASWGGMAPQMGLSEVRFSYVPVQARLPEPAVAATGVSNEVTLNWRPGRGAASHKVFFGADQAAVTDGTATAKTVTDHSFTPGTLNLGATYYWRVDEVNAAVTYPGSVWSFTTQDSLVVEDFESYTDKAGAEVFSTWVDGYTDGLSGSTVGLLSAVNGTFCETTIVHGGYKSMPMTYDNSKAPSYSEATRTFKTPQDWTAIGLKSLSLWFQGVAGNTGQLYVKINGTKVLYDGDAGDLGRGGWHVWNIDLSQAGKVNAVRTLIIGVEGSGSKGTVYIDDIRLYAKTPEYVTPVQPAATGLIAYYTFDEGTGTTGKDTSGKSNNGTIAGSTSWVAGAKGGALMLGGTGYVMIDGVAKSMPADNNFTVSVWIKTKGTGGYVIASNDAASGHVFTLGPASNGGLQVVANSSRAYGSAINDDQWHMITYVRNGTTASIFIDGALVGTETPSGDPATQTRWSIGQEWDAAGTTTPSDFYTGAVDDVRFYARPLSVEEVAGLFGLTKPLHKPF